MRWQKVFTAIAVGIMSSSPQAAAGLGILANDGLQAVKQKLAELFQLGKKKLRYDSGSQIIVAINRWSCWLNTL